MLSAVNCTCYHTSSPTLSAHPEILGKQGIPSRGPGNGPTAGIHVKTLPGLPASDSHAKTLKVTAPSSQEVITQQTKGWRHPWVPSGGTVITLPEQGHRSGPSRGPGVGPRQQREDRGVGLRVHSSGAPGRMPHKVVGFTSMSPTGSNGENQRRVPPRGGFRQGEERALKNTRALCSS